MLLTESDLIIKANLVNFFPPSCFVNRLFSEFFLLKKWKILFLNGDHLFFVYRVPCIIAKRSMSIGLSQKMVHCYGPVNCFFVLVTIGIPQFLDRNGSSFALEFSDSATGEEWLCLLFFFFCLAYRTGVI